MTPDPQSLLMRVAELLASELDPASLKSYGQQQLFRAGGLLQVVADEFDRAVAWRVEENTALRSLFLAASARLADEGQTNGGQTNEGQAGAALAARLREAADSQDNDLRVSALDAANQSLRALLVELQAYCESGAQKNDLRDLDDNIWLELRRGTERRKTPLDRF